MGAAAPPRDPRSNLRGRAALTAGVCVALVLALNVSTQLQKRGAGINHHTWYNIRKHWAC